MSSTPISSHPGFKWAVGAWFALLLGLGLFVMPAEVHATLSTRLGIATYLPDGISGRAALAGAAGLGGFLLGLVIAMRIAAQNEAAFDDEELPFEDIAETDAGEDVWLDDTTANPDLERFFDEAPRRPFNPREEIDGEGVAVYAVEDGEIDEAVEAEWTEAEIDEDIPAAVDAFAEESESVRGDDFPLPSNETNRTSEEGPITTAALGDLSLDALTARLGAALEAQKAAILRGTEPERAEADPVIAFLRREAERGTPEFAQQGHDEDPQAVLRSALDKLSRATKPN